MSINTHSSSNDDLQQNSDNELLSDISAYNSDEETDTVKLARTVKNPVFNEINSLLNNLQMESIISNDERSVTNENVSYDQKKKNY